MTVEVTRLDLRLRRNGTLAYSLGVAAYAVLIVAIYPAMRHDTSLDDLIASNPTLGALFGATSSLTTPAGWMNANLYANFVPLFALIMTTGYGAAAIAGQDEDGTLGGIASLPISRGRLLAQKVLALALLALPVPLVTYGSALLGRAFDLHLGTSALVEITMLLGLLAFDLGLLALAVGAWTGRPGPALGVATTVAALAYVVSSLAPVVGWIHAIRYLSPFYWSVGDNQLSNGAQPAGATLLITLGAAFSALAWSGVRRLDIH